MKLTNLLFLVTVFNVFGNVTFYGQNTLNLDMKDVQIKDVLSAIENQSDFYFLYSSKMVDVTSKVDVHVDNRNVTEVLNTLFKGTDITYDIKDRHILLSNQRTEISTTIQQNVITGIVSDSNGPIPGANVIVVGTTVGTMTDMNGWYNLTIPSGATTLQFSFIGMESQNVTIGSQRQINVTLRESAIGLEEVVVTALGIRRESKALTYAVTQVSGDVMTKARELNIGNALTGMVAGVTASGTTGGPGSSTRVIIRGNGSLAGDNMPLYVVNGVPITNVTNSTPGTYGGRDGGDGLSSINPDDIESISVLKGGTASALYGSRASNGVILITTKSGKAGQGIGVQFSSTTTMERAIDYMDWQYEYGSGQNFQKPTSQGQAVSVGRISWGAKLDGSMVMQQDGVERPYIAQKNNVKNFYQTGSTFSNTIAFTGGNETARFRFSAANVDSKSILPGNSVNLKTFNLSANGNLAKKIEFEGTAQYSIEDTKNRTNMADWTMNPNAAIALIATNIDVRILDPGYDERGNEMSWNDNIYGTNPYFAINKIKNEDTRNRLIGSFTTKYNITDWLYARVKFGLDQISTEDYNIQPTGILINSRGSMSKGQSLRQEINMEGILGFNKKFGAFSVNMLAGGNQMKNTLNGKNVSSGDFNDPFIYFIRNGSNPSFSERFSESAINSLFASADIDFNNYLYLTLTGRNDWFSTLDPNNNNIFYPSAGLSFLVSEVWNSRPAWMTYAKVRASWAQVGGGAPNPYGLEQTFSVAANPYFSQTLQTVGGTIPALLPPYISTTTEVGIEMRVFNGRAGIDLTVYDRTTTDDIVEAALAPTTAYNAVSLNVGEMKNRGIELMLSGTPVLSNRFSWDILLNMAYNKNEVIKISDDLKSLLLPGAVTRTLNGWIYHFEGEPFGVIAGNRQARDDNGQLIFSKTTGVPVAGPLEILGRGVPPTAISLNNTFKYKSFNLSFLLDSRWGGSIYSATNSYATDFGLHKNTVKNNVRETGITVIGVDQYGDLYNETITAQTYYRGIAYTITEPFVEKADFIKLRSFTFGYNLPTSMLNKTPFQALNVSLVGRNLLLLYNAAENIDPESNYSNSNAQGLENLGLPPTRSLGFNLNVTF